MKQIDFYKFEAAGNDFILIDRRKFLKNKNKRSLSLITKRCCRRKEGIGADGMLFIESAKKDDFKMRIFNSDGSEAEMCGNGARCAAFWKLLGSKKKIETVFTTEAGAIKAGLKAGAKLTQKTAKADIRIKITRPFGLKQDLPVEVFGKKIKVNFINTGVPHVVIFVDSLNLIDVSGIGRVIRFHKLFSPQGVNVNFVELKKANKLQVRTYERGVEAETLACGTGSVAAAFVYACKKRFGGNLIKKATLKTKGGQVLKVFFNYQENEIKDVWLEGGVSLVYRGRSRLIL